MNNERADKKRPWRCEIHQTLVKAGSIAINEEHFFFKADLFVGHSIEPQPLNWNWITYEIGHNYLGFPLIPLTRYAEHYSNLRREWQTEPKTCPRFVRVGHGEKTVGYVSSRFPGFDFELVYINKMKENKDQLIMFYEDYIAQFHDPSDLVFDHDEWHRVKSEPGKERNDYRKLREIFRERLDKKLVEPTPAGPWKGPPCRGGEPIE